MNSKLLVVLAIWAGQSLFAAVTSPLEIKDLKCEYRVNPLGVDSTKPRLSWILTSGQRGQSQTAYRVLAASSPDKLEKNQGDLWDSGQITGSNSLNIIYQGIPLHSGERIYWKVAVWDRLSHPSQFSKPAWWEMALLTPEDWDAKWITAPPAPSAKPITEGAEPAPLFRDEFTVGRKVSRARVYVSGLGYYELRLNGERVGDRVLDPGWTSYAKRVLYSTYDVTTQIKRGRNVIGLMAGNGWFDPLPLKMWDKVNLRERLTTGTPQVMLQLVIDFTDGSSQKIVTDENWRVHGGPIVRNSVYLGEVYDARKEIAGWDKPGLDDSAWTKAILATNSLGQLKAQSAPPIRITAQIKPVALTEPKPGVYIFDLGHNFAGWARLRASGAPGTRVQLRYGELLYPDGTLNGMTSVCGQIKRGPGEDAFGLPNTAFQTDQFILRGHGEETFIPHFTFHGFRYVEVTGLSAKPRLKDLEGLQLNSDVAPAGSFECSNELFNRIQEMVLRTELSNLFSVESDCPHREKFGYGGDMVAASEMAIFNFDMGRFYAKTIQDLADAVRPNGGFTETAPDVGLSDEGLGGGSGPIGWGTAHPQLQWFLYQYYGDRRLLEEHYDATKKWIFLLQSCASNNILDNGISDHESLTPKPRALTGTAFYFLNVKLFSQIARTLDHENDARAAEATAAQIRNAFNQRFLHTDTGLYDSGTQACEAFPLYLKLEPAESQPRVASALVHDVQEKNDGHLSTGIFGTKYLLNSLTDNGRADVAYQIVNQKTFPGWGYMLERGATTLWEHWEYSDNVYSHNHPMFGSVSEWFYKALAGINAAPDAIGFDRIIIKPQPVGDLRWVKAHYNSVRGPIITEWKRSASNFQLKVKIPVGATAMVWLPGKDANSAKENDQPLTKSEGVEFINATNNCLVLRVSSGTYDFVSQLQ